MKESEINKTPSANRLHISIFGKRNSGKSSLMNAMLGQEMAIVSDTPGTTTDPVQKAMEIAPLGPVVLIDTAGIDEESTDLGKLRVEKTLAILGKTDLALLVINNTLDVYEWDLIELFKKKECPFIVVFNKIDIAIPKREIFNELWQKGIPTVSVSAKNKEHLDELFAKIIAISPKEFEAPSILGGLIKPGDTILLVIPIDKGMPKGRLILPQVQIMRDILDNNATIVACKDTELKGTLENLVCPPKLVITDSQIFESVNAIVPSSIALTSFSILFARFKGDLETLYKGAKTLLNLQPHSKVLIAEACTHVQQDQDIATIKIPLWVKAKIDPTITFEFSNGTGFPLNLKEYALVIHCGGCMINKKEMLNRLSLVGESFVPITNYGLAIAAMHGILDRATAPFLGELNED